MNRTSNVNIDLGQRCLALIRDIADRGASSSDPDFIGYSIQELRQVLSETGNADEVRFLPVPPCEIHDLPHSSKNCSSWTAVLATCLGSTEEKGQ